MKVTHVSPVKITPPVPASYIVRRPALAKKLRFLQHVRLCLVHAEMGYGKTATFSAFLADSGKTASWYFIGKEDQDLAVFVTCLLASVRRAHPDFGDALLQELGAGIEQEGGHDAVATAELFIRELFGLEKEFVMVLDDCQHIAPASEVDQFVQQLAKHLPPQVKLVMLSRTRPAWPELDLLAVRGECLELTTDDLAFSREESETLYLDEYDVTISPHEWDLVAEVSRGWVLALRYFGEHVARGLSVSDSLRELSRLMYLLEAEVWSRLDVKMQEFLIQSAIFEAFEEQDCRHVLGEDAVLLLREALRCHLFVTVNREGVYTFHPLFRRLLASKLATHPNHLRIHRAAALWYRSKGETEKAYETLSLVEEWELLAAWLQEDGERLLVSGKLDFLYQWTSAVPDWAKEKAYWLYFYQGEVERYRCVYHKAFASYQHFLDFCQEKQDRHGMCRGLEGLARVHLDSVQGVKAEELLKQAIQLLPEHEQEPQMAPRLYRLLAEIYTNRGDAKQASYWYERSQELEQQIEVELESRLLFRTGRLQSAVSLLERKWQVEQTKHPVLTRSYRETSLLLAFVYSLNGEWEKGLRAAETAIELGRVAHSPFVEANGYVRKATAAFIGQALPFDEIRGLYEKGLLIMEELQSTRGKSETMLGLTLLYGKEKALDQALYYGKRGLQETEAMRDDWLNSLVRVAIGIAYATNGHEAEAKSTFHDCVERLSRCGDSLSVVICQLWLSVLAYRNKQWDLFVPAVTQALSMMQSGEYDFLLQRPTMLAPADVQQLMPILLEAKRRQVSPDYVSHLLNDLGLQNVDFHPGYTLRIQALGHFRVWLGDQELSGKAWQRGKAKLLFQLLLTRRHHLLAREEILTQLWGEQDEEAALRDFKVALNALHKALEPNRTARTEAFFVQRHGSSYGFNLASGYHLDVEEFEKLVRLGLEERDARQAIQLLEKGLAYYQGDYIPECRYEDWCEAERERLRVLFLRGAERVAALSLEEREWERAIRWCEAILRVDDCWEEAYRLLMTVYYRQNNRTLAMRWFEKCKQKLQEQLGVQPMPATLETYRQIVGEE
ncbi:BTAD domain-containing putative transcriptional regulator [Brevibacillus sp. TJ4]|uniref:BTAD domain-containing putative transcriptional regulator n=1 Tax=Brevibacillus sp. TJ4 TaxID=3234853 RepID=UPI003B9E1961